MTIQTSHKSATKKNKFDTRTAQNGNARANSPVERISLEILFGLVGNATVFGSLYASIPWWWKRKEKCDKEGILDDCGLGPSVMTLVAVPLGVITEFTTPLGVYLGGKTMDGSGSYGWTLLGHLSGVAVGFTSGYFLRNTLQSSENGITSTIPILAIATISQLTGAIVAYELSSKEYDGEETTVKEAIGRLELILTPVVTITNHDITIGTRGAF